MPYEDALSARVFHWDLVALRAILCFMGLQLVPALEINNLPLETSHFIAIINTAINQLYNWGT